MLCPLWVFALMAVSQSLLCLEMGFILTHTHRHRWPGWPCLCSIPEIPPPCMMDFCCACLTMWLGGSDWTWLWWAGLSEWLHNVPWSDISLYQDTGALQELFSKWCIIFHCRRHVLAPGPWGDMLWFSYWDLPENLQCIYPPLILLKP